MTIQEKLKTQRFINDRHFKNNNRDYQKTKFILVPDFDDVAILRFKNGEAAITTITEGGYTDSELKEMFLNHSKYKDILPFMNHKHNFIVIFQDSAKHEWEAYPHIDTEENTIDIKILFELNEDDKMIFEDEEHSFNIKEERLYAEFEDEKQLRAAIKSIDFLSSGVKSIETVESDGTSEIYPTESFILFQEFYDNYQKQQGISPILFEYFKRNEIMIVKDLFEIDDKIQMIMDQSQKVFDVLRSIIYQTPNACLYKKIRLPEKIRFAAKQVTEYLPIPSKFDKSMFDCIVDQDVCYNDMLELLKQVN